MAQLHLQHLKKKPSHLDGICIVEYLKSLLHNLLQEGPFNWFHKKCQHSKPCREMWAWDH